MKISIVIPTRNRSEFLRYCVKTCLACDDQDLEIVVSDNNSVDDTRQCIEAIADPRVNYVCKGQSLSMRQNFEFALEHATGEYILYLGDDDGILPNGMVTMRNLIARHKPDVVLWRHITYDWPRGGENAIPGRLKFRYRDFCGPMTLIDPQEAFKDFCKAKRINYRDGANIYHGCIHRRVVDKVRNRQNGIYFNDISPDINTSLTNLTASDSIVWFRNPVTIAGAGEKSTGYAFTPRTDISKVQKDVTEDYSSLMVEDTVQPKLGVAIRSIAAHTYANLCAIVAEMNDPTAAIKHDAWREIIIADVKTFKPEMRKWDVLEAFFQEVDPTYQLQGLMATDPEAREVTKPKAAEAQQQKAIEPAQHAPKKSGRIPDAQLNDVETVMRWIQAVTGKPYTPPANTALALIQQAYRSVGMRLRVKSSRH